ncbi:MAG: tail fiber domain-containing protein [Minisyncoccia bacterium]
MIKVSKIYKKFSTFTRFLAFSFLLGLVVSVSVFSIIPIFASALSNPYNPGETLDPDCLPGDLNCTVATLWSNSGSDVVFGQTGNIGIGTSSPAYKLTTIGDSYFAGNLIATGTLSSLNFTGTSTGTNTGDQDLSGLLPYAYASSTYLSISNASSTYLPLSASTSLNYISVESDPVFMAASSSFYRASNPAGYISSFSESDPLFMAASTSLPYLSSFVESDPLWNAASSSYLTTASASSTYYRSSNPAGYISSFSELDPVFTASSWSTTTNNSTNWNTAYSTIAASSTYWDTAYSWSNHANAGYLTSALASSTYLSTSTASSAYAKLISPLFTTPSLGVASATSINNLVLSTGAGNKYGSIALGASNLGVITTGSSNIGLGGDVLTSVTSGSYNIGIGSSNLPVLTTGSNNIALGTFSGRVNVSGGDNISIGRNSLYNLYTGSYNVAVGQSAMYGNTSSGFNTAVGAQTLVGAEIGTGNVALGYGAGYDETGSNNFYVDNQVRGSLGLGKAGSLLYGTFNATPANQTLKANATFSALNFTGTSTGNNTGDVTLAGATTVNGLTISNQALTLGLAGASATGTLSATDWNTFNNKLNSTSADLTYLSIASAQTNYLSTSSAASTYAPLSNVLALNNVTSFTPSANYHPATKKYVDDLFATLGSSGTSSSGGLSLETITASGTAAVGKLYTNASSSVDYTMTLPAGSADGSTIGFMNIVGVNTKATGGTITSEGNYIIHTFTAGGTFTALEDISGAEVLIVAGGGGGGGGSLSMDSGGGGGAGGLIYSASSTITSGAKTVVIGGGGNGGTGRSGTASNGENSTFNGLSAIGGGGGGNWANNGAAGGSGGGSSGASGSSYSGGAGTSGQGNAGGNNTSSPNYGGPGGGGAGEAGHNGTTIANGNGGDGLAYSISGTSTYYAGGGGHGAGYLTPSSGGLGGGGLGGGETGSAGTANTGGGGGGGSSASGASTGGAGGSGIVIVRYLSGGNNSRITVTPASGEQIYGYAVDESVTLSTEGSKLSLIKNNGKWYDAAFGIGGGGTLSIPSLTGNVGKYLTIDASSTLSWGTVSGTSGTSSGLTLTTITASGTAAVGNLYTNASSTVDYTMTLPAGSADGSTIAFLNIVGSGECAGGTKTYDGNYVIHTFNSSGTLSCLNTITAEVLVVGGGGASGTHQSGDGGASGGGGGGIQYDASFSIASDTYTVTVGNGGIVNPSRGPGGSGSSSSFSTFTSGGGGGGSVYNNNAGGGTSGSPQSNAGGPISGGDWGGGGGGAGGVGLVGNSYSSDTRGGPGLSYSISGTSTTYAKGGTTSATANRPGTANTGNGGESMYGNHPGQAGATGVVIVKYLRENSSVITVTPAANEAIYPYDNGESVSIGSQGGKLSLIKNNGKWYDAAFGIGGGSTASTTITSATTFAIGTTTSLATLTVSGNTYISDVLTVASTTGVSSILGKLSIGTSTSLATLTVAGDLSLSGKIFDTNYSAGTAGMILQSTGTSTRWVSTSSLGISGGSSVPELVTITSGTTTIDSTYNGKLITNAGATEDIILELPSRASVGNNFEIGIINEAGVTIDGGTATTSGADTIHTFTSGGTFTTTVPLTAEVLVVGGGGATARGQCGDGVQGGGGGGGVQYSSDFSIPAGTYTVTVGSGGPNRDDRGQGLPGSASTFSTLTAGGGLGGNLWNVGPGGNSGTPQSNAGAWLGGDYSGGGGGAGGAASGVTGGIGLSYSTGGATSTYAVGGTIGGPNTNGEPNTGNGGGGASTCTNQASGGSGIVIIRHPTYSTGITLVPASGDQLPGTAVEDTPIKSTSRNNYIKLRTTDTGWIAESAYSTASQWAELTYNPSSRSVKENFAELDKQDILNKIAKLDMTEWNYIAQDDGIKHIGPIAEDFYTLFGLGGTDKAISTIDPAGIALVGIQAMSKNLQYIFGTTSIETLANSTTTLETYTVTDLFTGMVKSALQKLSSTFIDTILSVKGMVIGSASQPSGLTIYDQTTKEPYCLKMNNGAMVTIPGICSDSSQGQSLTDEETTDPGPGPASTEEVTISTETSTTTEETATSTEDTTTSTETATTTEPVAEDTATTTPPTPESETTPATSETPPVEPEPIVEPTPEPTPTESVVEPALEPVVEEPAVEEPPVETPPAEETPAPEPTPEPPPAETPVI